VIAIPKFAYTRSPALMKAYRCIPCQHCGTDDGTVCGAHSNWAEHGKGRSIKASDEFCASLCFRCHTELDQGAGLTASQRKALWTTAHEKTVDALMRVGLWPKQLLKERA
jgi:hypothetical protein